MADLITIQQSQGTHSAGPVLDICGSESRRFHQFMKKLKLEIVAKVTDVTSNEQEPMLEQTLVYTGFSPAIHEAIRTMGASFIHGLGVSLSTEMVGEQKGDKKS